MRLCARQWKAYHSEAEDVRPWGDLSSERLGGHVCTGTHNPLRHHGGRRPLGRRSRQPEVGDLRHKVFI